MKCAILILIGLLAFVPMALADGETCPEWITCPPGYYLNTTSCLCVQCDTYDCGESEELEEGDYDSSEGVGFESSGGVGKTTEGFLNIIYSFQSRLFVWILLFIIFLIAIGVIKRVVVSR
jgi:hypothetical protein